jgi:hypothetical protein
MTAPSKTMIWVMNDKTTKGPWGVVQPPRNSGNEMSRVLDVSLGVAR